MGFTVLSQISYRVEQGARVRRTGCIYVQDTVFPIQARADDKSGQFNEGANTTKAGDLVLSRSRMEINRSGYMPVHFPGFYANYSVF